MGYIRSKEWIGLLDIPHEVVMRFRYRVCKARPADLGRGVVGPR